jgi:crotonobetainyl-CoA:carnitine CoA-transferase CaiB-like acyl-CoA transferase
VENRADLIPLLNDIFIKRSRAEWLEILERAKVSHGAINTVPQALSHPQAMAREMVQTIPHPTSGEIKLVGPAAKFSSTPAQIRRHPPLLGEHTDEILREMGLDESEVARLREVGAV